MLNHILRFSDISARNVFDIWVRPFGEDMEHVSFVDPLMVPSTLLLTSLSCRHQDFFGGDKRSSSLSTVMQFTFRKVSVAMWGRGFYRCLFESASEDQS